MVVTRTPLRISYCGGGSDLPAFFREAPGYVVSAAIDRYVSLTVSNKFDSAIRVAYSQTENVADVNEIAHPIVRAALSRYGPPSHVEIHAIADIPAGTGLGSSSSFTVGLLHALQAHAGTFVTPRWLAAQATQIEIEDCGMPIGEQDQAIAAWGGLRAVTFSPAGVQVEDLAIGHELVQALNAHTLLLATGLPARDAATILALQSRMTVDTRKRTSMLAEYAHVFVSGLRHGEMAYCGETMHAAWQIKRRVASGITTAAIDDWYAQARRAGAWGGKLCGAGGGGFLLFLAPPERHQAIVQATRLRHVPITIGVHGSQVVYAD